MRLKAIDLYAGVGGWGIGLRLAGIDVVAAYEWWKPAAETYKTNLGDEINVTDIRRLDLQSVPNDVDLVVGSPPCTEFSFSNRGGNGNLAEGLKDIAAFFRVVRHVNPKYWVMENVPRVAHVLRAELGSGGQLAEYADLCKDISIDVIDMSVYGLPQRRKRCIAGVYPRQHLISYADDCPSRTLGDVLDALRSDNPTDPLYPISAGDDGLTDHQCELPLNDEETRMNRDSKTYHPVYNNMPFPEPVDRAVRTVTATCTRVSRESIVIRDPKRPDSLRRPTVRERASLQGFPISYQFFGRSYAEKLKMVGNAIPPLFTYYVGTALNETNKSNIVHPINLKDFPVFATKAPPVTMPDTEGKTYPSSRRFRAAIPNLRFKSGLRFELANDPAQSPVGWEVAFYYGNSKNIHRLDSREKLDSLLAATVATANLQLMIDQRSEEIMTLVAGMNGDDLQDVWTRRIDSGVGPYKIVDALGEYAANLATSLADSITPELEEQLIRILAQDQTGQRRKAFNEKKIRCNVAPILAGFIVLAWFNKSFPPCRSIATNHELAAAE